jgi:hypothetical protein
MWRIIKTSKRQHLLRLSNREKVTEVILISETRGIRIRTIGVFTRREEGPCNFVSKLLQRRTGAAAGVALDKIYDVYMTPDGRVEGEDQATTSALEGTRSILRQSEKTENGLR